jgi:16S rRNA (cytosine967-C5)-methyltransferase
VAEAVTAPRRVALAVLERVREGDFADRALAAVAPSLEAREQAWVQELVYGTLRLRGRLDHILAALVRGGLASLEPVVLDVLRLGAYQLMEMGSVPPYAAVSQSVELARAAGAGRAAGLVNGVLQGVKRRGGEVAFPGFGEDPAGYLASWGSHPRWLAERWIARWGAEDARRLVEADNARPELFIRPIGLPVEDALSRLEEGEIGAEAIPAFPDSLRILPPAGPRQALAAVPAIVQDPAASMVVRYAEVPRGARVLDVCAAPGGKAVALADQAAYVVAGDLSVRRLQRVRSNVERVGLGGRIGMAVADARRPPYREADLVLVDAPCTGTGTLRRHPDGRWRVTEADLVALVVLQREILAACAPLVPPGGLLVYATCSLEPEENEEQVEWLLSQRRDFRREAPHGAIDGTMLCDGDLCVLPQRHGVDGAFAARLRRIA